MSIQKIRKNHRYSCADYLSWPDDQRWEFIDGVPLNMGPAPSDAHQRVVGELFRQIANALPDHPCQVRIAPYDMRLPEGDEEEHETDDGVQPDILVGHRCFRNSCEGCRIVVH